MHQGFRGSLPFAHAEVHAKTNGQPWKPKAVHDNASLLFTVYALREMKAVPWSGFHGRLSKNANAFQVRREETKKALLDLITKYQDSFNALDELEKTTRLVISLYGLGSISTTQQPKVMTAIENLVTHA